MSVSLADIWDEPLEKLPSSPPRAAAGGVGDDEDSADEILRPSKRRRSSLFLDDPDDIDVDAAPPVGRVSSAPNTSNTARPDIDVHFEDLDDTEPVTSTPFDVEAYRREAQRRAENEAGAPSSSYSRVPIQSSSPPPEGLGENGDSMTAKDGKGKDFGASKRRPIAKVDETRLLAKNGLPALVQQCQDFKPKGKGHEQSDLNRLLSVYQFWCHGMYPKHTFSDTVGRIEKVCRKKRMLSALSTWRDEVHGTINGLHVDGDRDADEGSQDGGSDVENAATEQQTQIPIASSPSRSRASSSAPSDPPDFDASHPPSRPPSSASEHGPLSTVEDDDDLFDFNAIMEADAGSSANTSATSHMDDSEMWAALDEDPTASDAPPPLVPDRRPSTLKLKKTPAPYEPSEADDTDMWDVLDGMEAEQQPPPPPESVMKPVPVEFIEGQVVNAAVDDSNNPIGTSVTPGTNDSDWDDMYA